MRNFFVSHRTTLLAGLLCAVFYWIFAYDLNRSDFLKFISLLGGLFLLSYYLIRINANSFWLLAGMGVLFRLIFIAASPNLSQDFYRFLWDGRLVIQGINPYLITPEMYLENGQEIVPQARELYAGMGALNGSHYSNYPPVNQLFFAIGALFASKSILGSAVVLRILIILADIGILYFGKKILEHLKLPVYHIFWFFLNPFIIIELTGNLHFESAMLLFVVWSLYLLFKGKWFWAAVLMGLSVSTKLIPLLLLPLFLQYFVKRTHIIKGLMRLAAFYGVLLATVILTFVPFLSSEFVSNFSDTIALWFQNFEFNGSVYYIIRWIGYETIGWNIIADVGKVLPLVIVGILILLTFLRKNGQPKQLITALLFGICIYFLLSTTVHPWYVATPLVLCVFTRYRFALVWSFTVMLSYSAYGPEGFSENLWLVALEYVIVIAFFVWELLPKKNRLQHAEQA